MALKAFALGDSITRTGGYPISDDLPSRSWAQVVADASAWTLDTFAKSGATTCEVALLAPTGTYEVGFVCAGANDVLTAHRWNPSTFESDFSELLGVAARLAPRIFVLGLSPSLGSLPAPVPYGFGRVSRINEANAIIERAALVAGAVFASAPRLSYPSELYGDHVHPNSLGSLAMGNAVLARMGSAPVEVEAEPSGAYLAHARRRLIQDVAKRPFRGLASSLAALR